MHGFERTAIAEQTRKFVVRCANSMLLCVESTTGSSIESTMIKIFSEAFKQQFKTDEVKNFSPNPLSCLRHLKWVKDMKLAKDFQQIAPYLPWGYSPRTIDQGKHLAIMDFSKMFEMGAVVAGLMYVDVEQSYPLHNHPSHEMYFIISGTARWRWGGHLHFRHITAGNLLYNHPYNWHGVAAGSTPVLALYIQVM